DESRFPRVPGVRHLRFELSGDKWPAAELVRKPRASRCLLPITSGCDSFHLRSEPTSIYLGMPRFPGERLYTRKHALRGKRSEVIGNQFTVAPQFQVSGGLS